MTRLLRIELRRNTSFVLPVIAVVWLIWPIGPYLIPIALWSDRSTNIQGAVYALGPFAAGAAAWTAYREHRHGAGDLLATTPRAAVTRGLTALAASALWATLGYVATAAVIMVITSQQATWGYPLVLPLLVGLLAVLASSALGFACGRLMPGRFTAPLVAVGLLGLFTFARQTISHLSLVGALSPGYGSVNTDASVFYPVQPDLGVLQCVFAIGVTGAALGATVWHAGVRRIGLAAVTTGVVLVGAAVGLVSSGHRDADDTIVVPALGSVAVRAPLPYTPVCGGAPLRVCVHPAYEARLSVLATALNHLAAPLAGTPGLPREVDESPTYQYQDVTVTRHGVLEIPPLVIQGDTLGPDDALVDAAAALALVDAPGERPAQADETQRAVAVYLVRQAGAKVDPELIPTNPAVRTAAARLAALSPPARHAWLATHISAVRAGTADLP
jgi:hypothetical protein